MGAPKLDSQQIIKKLDDIPSLPSVVYELSRIINDPMSSTKEVESVMSKDIGMTTKVLKLANSAYYAIPGGVSSLSRAISFIGFDTVHQLVLSASIIQALDAKGPPNFDVGEFWKHSIGVGIASEVIAKYVKHPNPSDVFTCGLVHDIGKVALHIVANDILVYVADECKKNKTSFIETEKANQYTPHTELGRMLGEKWRLPKSIQAVTVYHHERDTAKRGGMSNELNQVIDIVMLGNLLIHALKFGSSGHDQIVGAPYEVLERLMLNPKGDMPPLLKNLKASLDAASDFVRMIGSSA
jgi:HD-like signal output (HDOD) protein